MIEKLDHENGLLQSETLFWIILPGLPLTFIGNHIEHLVLGQLATNAGIGEFYVPLIPVF